MCKNKQNLNDNIHNDDHNKRIKTLFTVSTEDTTWRRTNTHRASSDIYEGNTGFKLNGVFLYFIIYV